MKLRIVIISKYGYSNFQTETTSLFKMTQVFLVPQSGQKGDEAFPSVSPGLRETPSTLSDPHGVNF